MSANVVPVCLFAQSSPRKGHANTPTPTIPTAQPESAFPAANGIADPCGLLALGVVSALVTRYLIKSTRTDATDWIEKTGYFCGAMTFLGVLGLAVHQSTPVLSALFDAVTFGGFALTGVWVALTVGRALSRFFGSLVRSLANGLTRLIGAIGGLVLWPFRARAARREDERRRAEQARAAAAAAQERAQAAVRSREDAKVRTRRDEILAQCEQVYFLHEPELSARFPREKFDAYCQKHLSADKSAEFLEARAKELIALIESHLVKIVPPKPKDTFEDVIKAFAERRRTIENADLDQQDEELLLSQLEEIKAASIERALKKDLP